MCEKTGRFAGKREENRMAVLAKPINKIAVIKQQDSQEFVREFNRNKVTKEFLDSCKKAGDGVTYVV